MRELKQRICSTARSRRSHVAANATVPNLVGKYLSAGLTAPLRTTKKKDQPFKKK
jgi:hypothetical protein